MARLWLLKYGYDLPLAQDLEVDIPDPLDDLASSALEFIDLSPEEETRRVKIFKDLKLRLGQWYRHHYKDMPTLADGMMDILQSMHEISNTHPRKPHAVDVYSTKFYEDRVKTRFDKLWSECSFPPTVRISMCWEFTTRCWEEKPKEFKDALEKDIEETHQKAMSEYKNGKAWVPHTAEEYDWYADFFSHGGECLMTLRQHNGRVSHIAHPIRQCDFPVIGCLRGSSHGGTDEEGPDWPAKLETPKHLNKEGEGIRKSRGDGGWGDSSDMDIEDNEDLAPLASTTALISPKPAEVPVQAAVSINKDAGTNVKGSAADTHAPSADATANQTGASPMEAVHPTSGSTHANPSDDPKANATSPAAPAHGATAAQTMATSLPSLPAAPTGASPPSLLAPSMSLPLFPAAPMNTSHPSCVPSLGAGSSHDDGCELQPAVH
ncbi:hypothetical protein Hypma_004695 [Hypsizygus marmoreus]|uniref:Uncharacterized protein n=1 Tax=Hypsizygus marmoreus TaxID=39966 RepID=A0A369J3R7_HYPMA|nr:hypothetical protein Hypma_004695 [Hypsizygus marmoreus]